VKKHKGEKTRKKTLQKKKKEQENKLSTQFLKK
jgi:hypothetical protein